jgi:hypothetical protein
MKNARKNNAHYAEKTRDSLNLQESLLEADYQRNAVGIRLKGPVCRDRFSRAAVLFRAAR